MHGPLLRRQPASLPIRHGCKGQVWYECPRAVAVPFELASRHNLIRAENGAIRFVPRIEKRPWTRSRVVLWSAKVLFRRGSRHMRRTYVRMGEKLARIRQPDHNDDAARRFDPAKEPDPRLWSEFCSRGFPSPIQGACGLRGNSGRIQRAYVSNGVRSPQ